MKTALITGICGFVGSYVAINLIERGLQVIGVDLSDKPKNKKLEDLINAGKVKMWKGDLNSFDFSSLERVDHVFQIAGKVSPWGDIRGFDKINVEGTKRVIDYAKNKGVASFLYLSSVAVYGFAGYSDLREEAPKNPFDNPYSISKLRAETMVVEECEKIGLPYVVIRPGNVYGPYDYTSSTHIYSKIESGKMPYVDEGKYKSCFVYVENLAEAIVTAGITEKAWNQDFNITDGFGETLHEYFSLVAKEMGARDRFISINAHLAKTVAAVVESFYKLFKIKKAPLITKFSTYQNCVDYHFSIEKARNILGFSPKIDLHEGVKRTVKWYKTLKN